MRDMISKFLIRIMISHDGNFSDIFLNNSMSRQMLDKKKTIKLIVIISIEKKDTQTDSQK